MAPFRGGRGGHGGRGSGGGKLARSGIRTRAGYRKFDSQRVKDVELSGSESDQSEDAQDIAPSEDEQTEAEIEPPPPVRSYNKLLQSFHRPVESNGRHRKRRKIEVRDKAESASEEGGLDGEEEHEIVEESDNGSEDAFADGDAAESDDEGAVEDTSDPFEAHFANPDDKELFRRLKDVQAHVWRTQRQSSSGVGQLVVSVPKSSQDSGIRKPTLRTSDELRLKHRLASSARKHVGHLDEVQQTIAPYLTSYVDLLWGNRTPQNAASLRNLACVHALNHVLKSRNKILKNSERVSRLDQQDLDLRDQGFTRPKVLILLETRQTCFKYADTIVQLFEPEQQENKQRFEASFSAPIDDSRSLPEDYQELFEGNNDNNFLTALKFTRKTIKFYSPFYTSDVILASPLGLRRILEDEDVKKRDYDFLSSIEIVIVDQADAMQMQNWENVESVFRHINLQLREAHGCDFSRVRSWYLDGHAQYLRQTIVFSAYITPEMNRLFNNDMLNVAGKVKLLPSYAEGAIAGVGGLSVKQTFSRFDAASPAADPDARFTYFTSTVLPTLLRIPKPADGARGILIFIPSYYDFLRLRNFFATSPLTQNLSFGAIHDYSDISAQRRARSHFLTGRHSFLLYTQRAHHFYRLKIRGVKRVVCYGIPDPSVFYEELIPGFRGTSLEEGRAGADEMSVRVMFSKWDGLKLERIVGDERVRGMLSGVGDTFDFI